MTSTNSLIVQSLWLQRVEIGQRALDLTIKLEDIIFDPTLAEADRGLEIARVTHEIQELTREAIRNKCLLVNGEN